MKRKQLEKLAAEHGARVIIELSEYPGELSACYRYTWGEAVLKFACLCEVAESLREVFQSMLRRRGLKVLELCYHPKDMIGDLLTVDSTRAGDRFGSLVPHGIPRWLRIYDNGGTSAVYSCGRCEAFSSDTALCSGISMSQITHPTSVDRYTVLFTGAAGSSRNPWTGSDYHYLAMSEEPTHPQGFCQHGSSKGRRADGGVILPLYKSNYLGKHIRFEDLPLKVRKVVFSEYLDLWKL